MKATLTIEVPDKGCRCECPLCTIEHESINYKVWYQCKANKLECNTDNCPLEIHKMPTELEQQFIQAYQEATGKITKQDVMNLIQENNQ